MLIGACGLVPPGLGALSHGLVRQVSVLRLVWTGAQRVSSQGYSNQARANGRSASNIRLLHLKWAEVFSEEKSKTVISTAM
jgi:hypothetical protein